MTLAKVMMKSLSRPETQGDELHVVSSVSFLFLHDEPLLISPQGLYNRLEFWRVENVIVSTYATYPPFLLTLHLHCMGAEKSSLV
jgi:hypothetical protein